jgi:hypothetical protein
MRISWSRNPHAKTPIPGKPSKSGLRGVWHKDNLYLRTSIIQNGKPPPNEYWFTNNKYKDDSRKPVVLREVVFSYLENQGREIIPPTHNKCGKRSLSIWKLCHLTYLVMPLFIQAPN